MFTIEKLSDGSLNYIKLTKSDSLSFIIEIFSPIDNQPYKLQQGDKVTLYVKRFYSDQNVLLQVDGVTTLDTNLVIFNIGGTQTNSLDYGGYIMQIVLLKSNAVETANITNGAVTEVKLSTEVQTKLNKTGATFSLADTGVSGVSYSNGMFTITHNFGTQAVAVVMRDSTNSYRQIPVSNDAPTTNTVRIYFAEQPTNNQYIVTIISMIF